MKILQVYKDVFPEVNGGIERYIHDLSLFLQKRGHSVEVLVAGGSHRILDDLTVKGIWSPFRILSNPIAPGYSRFLSETDADVVHFHLPLPTAVIAWFFANSKKPYIVTYHSDIVRQSFLLPFYGPILRRFLKGAAKVIATSDTYIHTSRFLSGLSNSGAIPIGVDLKRFRPDPDASRTYYLFVGRFRRYKGIFVLLDAWSKMHDPPDLILAGGGGPVSKIEEFIRVNKLPVTIEIDVTDDELVKLYQGARALILPSIQRSEAFGMVQVEAMACGTALISSNLATGVSWVNKHEETGYLFTTADAEALSNAVIKMEKSDQIRKKMSLNARKRAEEYFDSTAVFKKVEECLTKATTEI